jgi:hypothetical protein
MALKRVWLRKQWRSVYVQLDGTHVMPQGCACLDSRGGELRWEPLNCPIDDHRVRYMQAEDPEALRDRLYPAIDWHRRADWLPDVQIAGAPALAVVKAKTKTKGAA